VLPAVLTDRVLPGTCFAPFHWNDLFGEYLSINAVTQDGVDPISYQPEFKACAVALTRVAAPAPHTPAPPGARAVAPADHPPATTDGGTSAATDPGTSVATDPGTPAAIDAVTSVATDPGTPAATDPGTPAATVARILGLTGIAPPSLTDEQRHYLAGFVAGLATDARTGQDGAAPVLPERAPLDPAHTRWIDGLLGAVFSRSPGTAAPAAAPAAAPPGTAPPGTAPPGTAPPGTAPPAVPDGGRPDRAVLILWASQTGRAEDFAARAALRLCDAGTPARLHPMDDYATRPLPPDTDLLLITSTYGDGDAPDNGAGFLAALSTPDAPLRGVRYSVLGFGDSSYTDFCGHGRRIDERLGERGAVRLLPRVDCEPDGESRALQWLEEIATVVTRSPAPTEPPAPAPTRPPGPDPTESPEPAGGPPVPSAQPSTAEPPDRAGGSALRPAALTGNRLLSRPGAAKEVREFTIDLAGTGLTYRTGDTLAVMPGNCPDLVAEWLAVTGADPAEQVELPALGRVAFGEALRRYLEITRPGPDLLRFVAERGHDRHLHHMLHAGQRVELDKWLWGRQSVDVVGGYGIRAGAREWAGVFRRLQPRRYSISSSPLVHPVEARIMVSVVRFANPGGRQRKGVCSTYLADAPESAPVDVSIHHSRHFRPPDNSDTPMIMIGPGTGLAPFLGFLEDRGARDHQGPNWLFFGEQRAGTDFYHRDRLIGLRDDGFLTRLDVAFSRDQRAKVYVQDRMREQGAHLWEWIDNGAHLYVCGDATRMARDVDRALRDVIARHGGMTTAEATAYLRQLASDHRYVRDVY
jgi:sulfite reductase alpha subunit-like flavoprotein